jgi:hypothetical protein
LALPLLPRQLSQVLLWRRPLPQTQAIDGNLGNTLTFNPNSAGLWDNQPDFAEPPMPIEGDAAHWDHRVDDDHWEHPATCSEK